MSSGNPSGRPAIISELQTLARTHTPTALATLVEIMSNAASPPNSRVAAAVAVLDRGYGRPSAAVFVEMTSQVPSADREALLSTVVTAMDEMAASTKAAEKRAIEAEQRVSELEKAGGRRHYHCRHIGVCWTGGAGWVVADVKCWLGPYELDPIRGTTGRWI